MLDFNKLRESISIARNEILKPAKEKADVVKIQMLKKAFGNDFRQIEGATLESPYGFHLNGVTFLSKCDQYQNLNVKGISSFPPVVGLQNFAEAIIYVFESYGNPLVKNIYPFRTVSCLMIEIERRFKHVIDKTYAEEMLRIGDLYCEKNHGFRKWAFGTPPHDKYNLGASANLPQWSIWFSEIKEYQDLTEKVRKSR